MFLIVNIPLVIGIWYESHHPRPQILRSLRYEPFQNAKCKNKSAK